MLSEREQEGQVGMGRTIITWKDVMDAGPVQNYVTQLDVSTRESIREALERLREPENEDELERLRRDWPPPPPAPLPAPPSPMEEALSQTPDYYTDRLLKYIPTESVALYLTLQGIVLSSVEAPALNAWLWVALGIGIIGTPLYLWRIQQV